MWVSHKQHNHLLKQESWFMDNLLFILDFLGGFEFHDSLPWRGGDHCEIAIECWTEDEHTRIFGEVWEEFKEDEDQDSSDEKWAQQCWWFFWGDMQV